MGAEWRPELSCRSSSACRNLSLILLASLSQFHKIYFTLLTELVTPTSAAWSWNWCLGKESGCSHPLLTNKSGFLVKLYQALPNCLRQKLSKIVLKHQDFGSRISHTPGWPRYSYLPLNKCELKLLYVVSWIFCTATISFSSQHVAAINSFRLCE